MLSIVPRAQVVMSLQDHFGLAERPFGLGLDPRFLYQSASHIEALRGARRALQRREGLVVVTGAAGTGKTMLCRALLQQLDTPVCVSVVLDPRVTFKGLLRHVLDDFGLAFPASSPAPSRADLMKALQQFLVSLVPLGAYAVLVIDEAHALDPDVLEQIRLLLNLETDRAKLLQVVLIGQPPLGDMLDRPAMRQLAARIACRSELQSLGRAGVEQYIEHRLAIAQELTPLSGAVLLQDHDGGSYSVSSNVSFTPAAVRRVAELSRGIPRAINLLCDRALEVGYEGRRHTIDARIVRAAARRLALAPAAEPVIRAGRRVAAATALALAAAGFGTWTWAGDHGTPPPPSAPAVFRLDVPPLEAVPASVALLPLADSFHVKVASFGAQSKAADLVGRLETAGLPAFVRPESQRHHVVVGPYLSEAEGRSAAARVADLGHSDAALFVERTAGAGIVHAAGAAADGEIRLLKVVALPTGDRVSVAFALSGEPQKAAIRVLSDRVIELETGPVAGFVAQEVLAPPPGAPIVREVSVRGHTAANGEVFARARVIFHEPAMGNVRIVGRVVYVDLTTPPSTFPTLTDVATADRPPQVDVSQTAEYRAVVRRVLARLEELGPFLESAAAGPSSDVLAAAARALGDVGTALHSARVPAGSRPLHDLLLAVVTTAGQAVAPGFRGDRAGQVAHALALLGTVRREAEASGGS